MPPYSGEERRQIINREPEDLGWIKKALVGSLVALSAHFGGGIWWAATQTAKMDFVQQQILAMREELKDGSADRYRNADAVKDFSAVNARIERNESRIQALEKRIYSVVSINGASKGE